MLLKQRNTFVLNKPLGIISCQPYDGDKYHSTSAVQLLTSANYHYNSDNKSAPKNPSILEPYRLPRLAAAGRLDINSTGLLLFTQCGVTARTIVGPDSTIEKEYLVRINKKDQEPLATTTLSISDQEEISAGHNNLPVHVYQSGVRMFRRRLSFEPIPYLKLDEQDLQVQEILEQLRNGIVDPISGEVFEAKSVEIQNEDQLRFVLTSGKYHHIRRMLEAVHLPAQAIKRIRIGTIRLGTLPLRHWRQLYPHEQAMFTGDK
jgi:23S rRNA pseudouridine2604 synthase